MVIFWIGIVVRISLLWDSADLISSCPNSNTESGPDFSVLSIFQAKDRFQDKNCKNCLSSVAHKTLLKSALQSWWAHFEA